MWLFTYNHTCFGYIQITTLNNKNTFGAPYSVAVDKKSSFIFVLDMVPRTLEITFQSFQISKYSGGECQQTHLSSRLLDLNQLPTSNFIKTPILKFDWQSHIQLKNSTKCFKSLGTAKFIHHKDTTKSYRLPWRIRTKRWLKASFFLLHVNILIKLFLNFYSVVIFVYS